MIADHLSKDAFRALTYLPGDDRPDEWIATGVLARHLTDLYGPVVGAATPTLLNRLRRRSMAVRRRTPDGEVYRRTPTGTAVLQDRGRGAE